MLVHVNRKKFYILNFFKIRKHYFYLIVYLQFRRNCFLRAFKFCIPSVLFKKAIVLACLFFVNLVKMARSNFPARFRIFSFIQLKIAAFKKSDLLGYAQFSLLNIFNFAIFISDIILRFNLTYFGCRFNGILFANFFPR